MDLFILAPLFALIGLAFAALFVLGNEKGESQLRADGKDCGI